MEKEKISEKRNDPILNRYHLFLDIRTWDDNQLEKIQKIFKDFTKKLEDIAEYARKTKELDKK